MSSDAEAEKQTLIWKAFGVDHSKEVKDLVEHRNRILMQVNSSLLMDEVRELIERVVREEVRRILCEVG